MKESQHKPKYLNLACSGWHGEQGGASSVCWLLGTGSLPAGLDCLSSLELFLDLRVCTLQLQRQAPSAQSDRHRQANAAKSCADQQAAVQCHCSARQYAQNATETQLHSCTFELLVVNGFRSVFSTGFALTV